MLCTSDTQDIRHATVDEFSLLRQPLLCGQRLDEIRALQESIARFGLLSPIIAIRQDSSLVVVDGRKRLAAIRRLAFQGRLPRSLVRIPYLVASDTERRTSILVHNRELYEAISEQAKSGASVNAIADRFYLSRQCVRDSLSLTHLDPIIREAFFRKLITIQQAQAYAAIPDRTHQVRQLRRLGLFATTDDILTDPSDNNGVDQVAA